MLPADQGRSPFPPISSYGFLSDTETTALVSQGGNVEWLCLPRMDSPSVFGAILDRDAGTFRLGPDGVQVPADRRYLPGTLVLETSWDAPGGWIIVRDTLVMGPWRHERDRSNTHRRAPTDYDAEHILLRTVRCVDGEVQVTLDCEPAFEYGLHPGTWEYTARPTTRPSAGRRGATSSCSLITDLNLGIEGPRATARHLMKEGEQAFCALSWSDAPGTADVRRRLQAAGLDRPSLAALAGPRRVPGPSMAQLPPAQRADPQGPQLRPHRRAGRRRHHLAAGDARRRAQLGLPLHVVPRRDVHAVGPLHARVRLGGQRLLLLPRRRGGVRGGPAPDHVRHRRPRRAARDAPRPPQRLRGRAAGARGQRRLRPGPARRLGRDPGLVLPPHEVARPPARPPVADPQAPGGGRAGALARARPGHVGGAGRAQALHLLQAHVLGGGRPRAAARRAARGLGAGRAVGGRGGRDPRRHLRARARRARRVHPALRHRRRSTRRCC